MYNDYDVSVIQCLNVHLCTYNVVFNEYVLPTI